MSPHSGLCIISSCLLEDARVGRLLADCPHFSFGGCSFKVLRSKETTGRVVVWRQFANPNSFTLEASFCGADFGPGAGAHYTIGHLKEMGA